MLSALTPSLKTPAALSSVCRMKCKEKGERLLRTAWARAAFPSEVGRVFECVQNSQWMPPLRSVTTPSLINFIRNLVSVVTLCILCPFMAAMH